MVKRTISRFRSSPSNPLIVFFLILGAVSWGLRFAGRSRYITIPQELLSFIDTILYVAITFLIASVVVRLTGRFVLGAMDDVPVEQRLLARKLYIGVVYFFALAFLLWRLGATLESLTVMLGLVAGGLAFTLREILISYWVWFMLLRKKPFRIGDYIRIGDDEGVVKHIGTFYVVLDDTLSSDEDFTRIPNKQFTEKSVVRLGRDKVCATAAVPITNFVNIEKKLAAVKKKLQSQTILSGPTIITRQDKVLVTCSALVPREELDDARNTLFSLISDEFSRT